MRLLLSLFICLFSIACMAQDSTSEYKARRDASLRMMAPHGYLRLFLADDVNDVVAPLQMFMDEVMSMTLGDDEANYKVTKLGNGKLQAVLSFHDKISYSKPAVVKFSFITNNINNVSVVESASITGDRKRLIDFFVRYWNTRINMSDKAAVVAERNMPGEKVSLINSKGILSIAFKKM